MDRWKDEQEVSRWLMEGWMDDGWIYGRMDICTNG